MRKPFTILFLLALLSTAWGQQSDSKILIGEIEFFGVKDFDLGAIRAALPFSEGQEVSTGDVPRITSALTEAIMRITGRAATDVSFVCCDNRGAAMIYIGLPHRSSEAFRYKPTPSGNLRLPDSAVSLYDEVMELNIEAVPKNAGEEQFQGYALSLYPPLRARELAVREYAVGHEKLLRQVVLKSGDAKQREVAAYFLGYGHTSRIQIATLVSASRDSFEGVRNNAVRALGVLAKTGPASARQIPADSFIGMLNSGEWTDRNKAAFLLAVMSASREPRLLRRLRMGALPSLIEMARWRSPGHATHARIMLGRIGGIPESELLKLVAAGEVKQIIAAAQSSRRLR